MRKASPDFRFGEAEEGLVDRPSSAHYTRCMTNVAVFDMNETTLDLVDVRVTVNDVLDSADGFTMWFQKLLKLLRNRTVSNNRHTIFIVPISPKTIRYRR